MSLEYLRDDESFVSAHSDESARYLFERRVGRQVCMELDTTCVGILEHLGINTSKEDKDFTEADGNVLDELEGRMTNLILDICRRKKA